MKTVRWERGKLGRVSLPAALKAQEEFSGRILRLRPPVIFTMVKGIRAFDGWLDDIYSRSPQL